MNPISKLKLYLDTTIPSYVFADDSPARMLVTTRFMQSGSLYGYDMVISDVVLREINGAAQVKRELLLDIVKGLAILPSTEQADELAQCYLEARALPKSSLNDALHVAIATLYNVDALISWNFGHLVNIRRKQAIAAVNVARGLPQIEILTPEEVLPS